MLPYLFFFSLFSPAFTANAVEHLAKISSITQDEKGFIWLAGHQGLTRFDGNNSITFSANDNNWQIPFTWSHELEPYMGKFLVSSENNGSWLFDPDNGDIEPLNINTDRESHYHTIAFENSFYTYSNNKIYKHNISSGETQLLTETEHTAVFAKSTTDLYIELGPQGLYILEQNNFKPLIQEGVKSIAAVNEYMIATTNNAIYTLQGDRIIEKVSIAASVNGLVKEHGTQNFFAISDAGNISKYRASTLEELSHGYASARKGRVKVAFHDKSNVLWLATSLGVETIVESAIKNHPIVFDIANNSNEITIFQDELIIGSYGMGLQTFTPNSSVFPERINNAFTSRAQRIMDVIQVNNDLYIATFDGVWHYHTATRELSRLPFPNNDELLLKLIHLDGLLYLGSNDNGLIIYDIEKNKVVDHVTKNDGLLATEIIDIIAFENGDVWLATSDGISIYNRFSKYINNIPGKGPSKNISLQFIENKIFAATLGDGVFIYDRKGTLLSVIAKGIEFTYSNVINDEIWIGSAFGLYLIDPKTHQYNLMPGTERFSFSGEAHVIGNSAFVAHYGGIIEVPLEKSTVFDANVYIGKTIVSGKQHLLNQEINISSSSDVVTLELVSLDYRPGQEKQFKYKINHGNWNNVNGSHLTLTGLASGNYQVEVMATNSLGQWSSNRAYTSINVAYPWYWAPKIRIIYAVTLICLIALGAWLTYLRTQSIRNIHYILAEEMKSKGKRSLSANRNINLMLKLLDENKIEDAKALLHQNLEAIEQEADNDVPDGLYGKKLGIALPYFADYLQHKYHVNLQLELDLEELTLNYELQTNLYKIVYEAVTCAILNGDGRNFHLTIQEFKSKLWLTISDDETSFSHFNNKITFNMSMYYIRQIANKYNASVNTFEPSDDKGSQMVISFPMMSMS